MTVEELVEAFKHSRCDVDAEKAAQIVGVIDGSIDPESFSKVEAWVRQCYNKPRKVELKLAAIDQILDTHGVEALQPEGAYVDSFWGSCILSYCNTGDAYATTIGYDTQRGEFVITSWGGFLEAYELENPPDEDEDENEDE